MCSPIDDDEYASVQAVTAIAAKGVPEYQEGVWYTRSPLYHYLAGGRRLDFRRQYFRSATVICFLRLRHCIGALETVSGSSRQNRLLALVALFLYAIHPYLAYTGHVARFYQQQQFFHLLGLCFFVRGFIANSGMRDRYLAVAALCAAALSQEITVLQILPSPSVAPFSLNEDHGPMKSGSWSRRAARWPSSLWMSASLRSSA